MLKSYFWTSAEDSESDRDFDSSFCSSGEEEDWERDSSSEVEYLLRGF